MAGRRTEVVIGDNTYHVMKFEPFLSLEVLGELQKHFLGPVTRAFEAKDADGAEATKAVIDGIDKLSSNLDGKTLVTLAKLVLNPEYIAVSIDGGDAEKLTPAAVNRAFSDVGEMGELIMEVVKINYEGFMRRSLSLIGQGRGSKAAKPSGISALN